MIEAPAINNQPPHVRVASGDPEVLLVMMDDAVPVVSEQCNL